MTKEKSLLETEEAIHSLLNELKKIKKASEQVELSQSNVDTLAEGSKKLVDKISQLVGKHEDTLDKIDLISADINSKINYLEKREKSPKYFFLLVLGGQVLIIILTILTLIHLNNTAICV